MAEEPLDELLDLLVGRAALELRSMASARSAQASEAVSVSTTRTTSPPSSSAARTADSWVPESFEVRWSDQMRVYPAATSSSYTARKSAGVGCEVVGSELALARRS